MGVAKETLRVLRKLMESTEVKVDFTNKLSATLYWKLFLIHTRDTLAIINILRSFYSTSLMD